MAPGYWRAMGIPLLAGRELDDRGRFDFSEGDKTPTRAVVNRSFAKRFFGNASAVGRHFGIGEHKNELGVEIVGVVEDSLYAGPRQGPRPMMYLSYSTRGPPPNPARCSRCCGALWRSSTHRCRFTR